jgi:hypothetical protein
LHDGTTYEVQPQKEIAETGIYIAETAEPTVTLQSDNPFRTFSEDQGKLAAEAFEKDQLYVQLGKLVNVEYDGKQYTIELVGATSDKDLVLDINGYRKTLGEGDDKIVNGLHIEVHDAFVTNIPKLEASANIEIYLKSP